MNIKFLQTLREAELELIISKIPANSKVLEIGAGTGWQSKILSEKGFLVEAIDIKESEYTDTRIWPVTIYDGFHIPFSDSAFDVVFSSNVLEHIPQVEDFLREVRRVCKKEGLAIHIVPSGSWRFWTNVIHYPHVLKLLFQKILSRILKKDQEISPSTSHIGKKSPFGTKLRNFLFPSRHGETGTFLTEMYYFSRFRWNALFKKSGWIIKEKSVSHLFYSGYTVLGFLFPLALRKAFSCLAGSSCHVYLLVQKEDL